MGGGAPPLSTEVADVISFADKLGMGKRFESWPPNLQLKGLILRVRGWVACRSAAGESRERVSWDRAIGLFRSLPWGGRTAEGGVPSG